jgi:transcriptional regulator with GAF, ATPase, and Fis domain
MERMTATALDAAREEPGDEGFELADIVGRSPQLQDALRRAQTVARTDSTVLIFGETGTGKEMVARAIHHWSSRHAGRIVKLNVAAIPSTLLESELFGHEKGAFTGAFARRAGRFELAQDGTLFLDEIGEMPLDLQPKLLRLLQEREYERLGGCQTIRSNARLIAATNRDLAAMVDAKSFREDLFYRLNVFPIRVPPLRERREDIATLARSFAERFAHRMGKRLPPISSSTLAKLSAYSWPGNIRELQNLIERAAIMCTGENLEIEVPERERASQATVVALHPQIVASDSLDDVQRQHILRVLESTDWVVGGPRGAAAKLGMKRSTLNFRIKKLGLTQRVRQAFRREVLSRSA